MLVTTKELLCVANAENKAIGAFDITGPVSYTHLEQ